MSSAPDFMSGTLIFVAASQGTLHEHLFPVARGLAFLGPNRL